MGNNTFGKIFNLTTAGESHGLAYVGIVDGVPSNCSLSIEEIQQDLDLRAPGNSVFASKRKEPDRVEILSGIYKGKTTGAPIAFLVKNLDARPKDYESMEKVFRPGHADYTYNLKYTNCDMRGGGRASGRETLCRVIGGSIAKQILRPHSIDLIAAVQQIHTIRAGDLEGSTEEIRNRVAKDPLGCFDPIKSILMQEMIQLAAKEGDSLGGSLAFRIEPIVAGLGEPVYGKLTNRIGEALLTIPGVKGVVFGKMGDVFLKKGSEFNDPLKGIKNDAAGLLGGISSGEAIYGEVFIKPPSSISKEQLTSQGAISIKGRHDPVIAPRARIVVESMLWMTLLDVFLQNQLYQKN
ncbi:MAG: chorismate synthase [Chlamydiia bacterium]